MDDWRHDRAEIRSPVRLPDGSVRFQAVHARAGVPLRYLRGGKWVTEVATREALSDATYLDGLRGLPVRVGHPESGRHRGERQGTITLARWDDTIEPEGGVVTEYVITDSRTAERVMSGDLGEVSEGYRVPVEHQHVREDGVIEQRRRVGSDHLALVDEGRMPGADTRLDEVQMTDEQIKALADSITAAVLAALKAERADAEKAAQAKADADEKAATTAKADETAREAVIDEKAREIASEIIDLHRAADELGVDVPDDVLDAATLRADIARKLGADEKRADSADYARGVIDLARAQRKAQAEQQERRSDAADFAARTTAKTTTTGATRRPAV